MNHFGRPLKQYHAQHHTLVLLSTIVTVAAFSSSLPAASSNIINSGRQRIGFGNSAFCPLFSQASTASPSNVVENSDSLVDDSEVQLTTKKSYALEDGFIFGLENSGLERPKGKQALLVVEDDSLETKPYQVAVVASTLTVHALFMIYCLSSMLQQDSHIITNSIAALSILCSSWVLADLGSGIFHWSVDNYGNGKTPILGSIIAAFQGHHTAPWTITQRGFCNNTYKLCVPFGIPSIVAISELSHHNPMVTLFFASFLTLEVLSQEFHKWSHMTKAQVPQWVNVLQDLGVTVPRTQHALHHMAPYEGNYCIVSGVCNQVLDTSGFFRRLEKLIYEINGVESNAWKLDPELRSRTLREEFTPKS